MDGFSTFWTLSYKILHIWYNLLVSTARVYSTASQHLTGATHNKGASLEYTKICADDTSHLTLKWVQSSRISLSHEYSIIGSVSSLNTSNIHTNTYLLSWRMRILIKDCSGVTDTTGSVSFYLLDRLCPSKVQATIWWCHSSMMLTFWLWFMILSWYTKHMWAIAFWAKPHII